MDFGQMKQEVYNLTNRPDLEVETTAAIKAATLKAHRTDFYSKDLAEVLIEAPELAYIHSIDYINIAANFRALKYLRKYDPLTDEPGGFISVITPDELMDSYGIFKEDVAYIAGRVLQVRSSTEIRSMFMGCYVNPVVSESNYASWVAELQPFAIVYEAVRVVLKTIGKDAEANSYGSLVAEEYAELKINSVSDVGY